MYIYGAQPQGLATKQVATELDGDLISAHIGSVRKHQ